MITQKELSKSAVEIIEILKNAPNSVKDSIPNQIKMYLQSIVSKEYKFKYNFRKQPYDQDVSNLTKALLSELYITFMCPENKKAKIDMFFENN